MAAQIDHPQRYTLANELHARPFAELSAPERVSHLAMLASGDERDRERRHLLDLCGRFGVPQPPEDATHFITDFGTFRLKWERHTEFTTYMFLRHGPFAAPFAETAADLVPPDWLSGIPGQRVVALHLALMPRSPGNGARDDGDSDDGGDDGDGDEGDDAAETELARHFTASSLCRSAVMGGAAQVATDFRIHGDGFGRLLVLDRGLLPRQAGRLIQRLIEVQTYRDVALLALPMARETGPVVARVDAALAALTAQMKTLNAIDDEQALLDDLIALSAEIEESIAAASYRFSAARAYEALVRSRVEEIGERPVGDYPMLGTFAERRFAPAMRTCESVAQRQSALSERATRAANLLRTRVDIKLERQNRDLLASMDRRAKLQLRLQQTVEGISIAAITYYLVSLIGYLAAAAKTAGAGIDSDLAKGLAVPVVAALVWYGVRRAKAHLGLDGE